MAVHKKPRRTNKRTPNLNLSHEHENLTSTPSSESPW